jgi:histidinol dehydrogenase
MIDNTMSCRTSRTLVAIRKPLAELTSTDQRRLFDRGSATDPEIERVTSSIIADVRDRGDAALRELAERFDSCAPDQFEVPLEACAAALQELDPVLRSALEEAATAIRDFHLAQLPPPLEIEVRPGVRLGRRAEPLRSVGVYAPGGRASYPSSVLMGVVPARAAGVGQIIVCSPPGPDGLPPAAVLAASALAGADRVFAIGGAGAIAALAFGTSSVPKVDKVVGPGNAFVTEAKRQLTGTIAIDCPAGPSEVLIIADSNADPEIAALELIAQAEHDPLAAAVIVTICGEVAAAVDSALERLTPMQPRREIIEAALGTSGAVLTAASLDEALAFAERYAPEHLLLLIDEPRAALDRVRAAGTIFLGAPSSVAFGDYITGANHVLPTARLARSYSGLSTLDFLRFATYQEISPTAAAELAGPTATLAAAEGLPGHAAAARARGEVRKLQLRTAYRDIEPYDPDRRPVELDLSDNTNLFGANPAALAAVAALSPEQLTRYPAVDAAGLRAEIAALHGVAPENVTTGCGLDDVIDSTLRAFCDPGDTLAYPDPTFGMVELFARMNAVRPLPVPLGPDLELDTKAILAARGRVTYICQPNNPTGNLWDRTALERLAAHTSGIVLIDEAYADYADSTSLIDLATSSDRVLLLRTLSKAYGLAGLRIGYAIGPAALIREIEKSRGPYKITAAADVAARAVIREGGDWVRGIVQQTVHNRERLIAELEGMGFRPLPSTANFVLMAVGAAKAPDTALALAASLQERGIAVRAFPGLPGLGDCIRITIGPWESMQRLLDALGEVLLARQEEVMITPGEP